LKVAAAALRLLATPQVHLLQPILPFVIIYIHHLHLHHLHLHHHHHLPTASTALHQQRPSASSNISLEFIKASAEALPFEDASFDAVTIAFGLRNVHRTVAACCPSHHAHMFSQVTDTSKALTECLRVLKKGGRFMCDFLYIAIALWTGVLFVCSCVCSSVFCC
jgi:hypothetical protein